MCRTPRRRTRRRRAEGTSLPSKTASPKPACCCCAPPLPPHSLLPRRPTLQRGWRARSLERTTAERLIIFLILGLELIRPTLSCSGGLGEKPAAAVPATAAMSAESQPRRNAGESLAPGIHHVSERRRSVSAISPTTTPTSGRGSGRQQLPQLIGPGCAAQPHNRQLSPALSHNGGHSNPSHTNTTRGFDGASTPSLRCAFSRKITNGPTIIAILQQHTTSIQQQPTFAAVWDQGEM